MKKIDIHVSIVIYKTPFRFIKNLLKSLSAIRDLNLKITIIENYRYSNTYLTHLHNTLAGNIKLIVIRNNKNIGFGKAHNIALRQTIDENIKYHLVLNPDIYFEEGVLEELYDFMEKNPDVGLVMPKVLYPDGKIQYLCKLLPTPLDLFGRRFLNKGPLKKYIEKRNEIYELRFTGYNKIMEVPYLSGCFMFIRTEVLKKVGLFDERFFMYLEDTDLSRRIHRVAKTIYYPYVHIYHEHQKGSYKNLKLLKIHIESAIKYFNKWGWFNDSEREAINRKTLEKLKYKNILS